MSAYLGISSFGTPVIVSGTPVMIRANPNPPVWNPYTGCVEQIGNDGCVYMSNGHQAIAIPTHMSYGSCVPFAKPQYDALPYNASPYDASPRRELTRSYDKSNRSYVSSDDIGAAASYVAQRTGEQVQHTNTVTTTTDYYPSGKTTRTTTTTDKVEMVASPSAISNQQTITFSDSNERNRSTIPAINVIKYNIMDERRRIGSFDDIPIMYDRNGFGQTFVIYNHSKYVASSSNTIMTCGTRGKHRLLLETPSGLVQIAQENY